jgi:hypothetical protein
MNAISARFVVPATLWETNHSHLSLQFLLATTSLAEPAEQPDRFVASGGLPSEEVKDVSPAATPVMPSTAPLSATRCGGVFSAVSAGAAPLARAATTITVRSDFRTFLCLSLRRLRVGLPPGEGIVRRRVEKPISEG